MTPNNPAGGSSPHTLLTTPASRPYKAAGKVELRAASGDAVLAVVPHMLGFYPSRSLVVLGLGQQRRVMVTFRYDLPEPGDDELAEDIAAHAQTVLEREHIPAALLVGYGPADLVFPVLSMTAARLADHGIELQEALRAEAGRYWSVLCDDPVCCPPEGRSYDPGSHPAAVAMTQAGLSAHPDREALARTLQRPAGSADAVARATQRARLALRQVADLGTAEGEADPRLRATRIGRKAVKRAILLYRAGGRIATIEELAWLAVLLADTRVRDDAWARMDPAFHDQHSQLWTDVIRAAATEYLPAPACLLAFTSWQSGNGALAGIAVERALAADPGYSMARLLADAIHAALPPSAARLPMSPAAVAASYAPMPPGGAPRSEGTARRVPRARTAKSSRAARARRASSVRQSGGSRHA